MGFDLYPGHPNMNLALLIQTPPQISIYDLNLNLPTGILA